MNLADSLNTQVVEALKGTEKRHEDTKKRQIQYFQKLLSERDKSYSDRLKVRGSIVARSHSLMQVQTDKAKGRSAI